MKIAASLVILLLSFACNSAQAGDARCDAPPYGATPADTKRYLSWNSRYPEARFLQRACEIKYEHANARVLGFAVTADDWSDEQIQQFVQALSVPDIANIIWAKDYAKRAAARAPPPEPEDGSRVYALLYCTKGGYCQIYGQTHIVGNGVFEETPYRTLAECQRYAYLSSSGIHPDSDGRTVLPDGSWWECRSKHVDMWESAR
jgi:hypothetical protein